MSQTIQVVKPNLHLLKGVYDIEDSQEVVFSCNYQEDLMKASRHIDAVTRQAGKTLKVAEWELKYVKRQITEEEKYEEKYTAPLAELLDAITEYRKGEFTYFRPLEVPFGHKIYAHSEATLLEASEFIREKLKDLPAYLARIKEETGIVAMVDNTRELLEARLQEKPSTVAFHVDVGVNNQGCFPVGRVSIYPAEKDAAKVADIATSIVIGLKQFGGPGLSNDASIYLHQSDWMRRNAGYVAENSAFFEPHDGYRGRLLAL